MSFKMSTDAIVSFASLVRSIAKQIEQIDVSYCNLDAQVWQMIEKCRRHIRMQSVAGLFESLLGSTGIITLNVSGNKINPESLNLLDHCTTLSNLALSSCHLNVSFFILLARVDGAGS